MLIGLYFVKKATCVLCTYGLLEIVTAHVNNMVNMGQALGHSLIL